VNATTRYFQEQVLRKRPYLTIGMCRGVIDDPLRRAVQEDGRIRHWARVVLPGESEARILPDHDAGGWRDDPQCLPRPRIS
jgi:hypothetical protein